MQSSRTNNRSTAAPKNLFIVGPTASGKSSLAMRIARVCRAEIICADSQTVRKELDIGTAKPSRNDRQEVPHHLVDIIEPFADFSVADFKRRAETAITAIKDKNKLPIIVGGSGMYVDSLLFDYNFGDQKSANSEYTRTQLERMDVQGLQKIIAKNQWLMPENSQNPRHLIGVIMRGGAVLDNRKNIREGALVVGIQPDDETLKKRISQRIDQMFNTGFIDEVSTLLQKYGTFPARLDAIGYPIAEKYLNGVLAREEAKAAFKRADWQYARRQKAWFKRNPYIEWFDTADAAYNFWLSRVQ